MYEAHEFTSCGFVENALLDVHRNDIVKEPSFSQAAIKLFSDKGLLNTVANLLGDECILVQSMYFESSKSTPEHFDKYFLGSEHQEPLVGVWIAMEDIEVSAGEFYIYPTSHIVQFDGNEHENELMELIEKYKISSSIGVAAYQAGNGKTQIRSVMDCKRLLAAIIEKAGWKRFYPRMKKGDVLLFSSNTLHGSNLPSPMHRSRNSLTGHFIGRDQKEIRFGTIVEPFNLTEENGLFIHLSNRYDHQNSGSSNRAMLSS